MAKDSGVLRTRLEAIFWPDTGELHKNSRVCKIAEISIFSRNKAIRGNLFALEVTGH